MASRRYSCAAQWQKTLGPYPAVERDETFVETFKSAKQGEVKVPDPYHVLEEPFHATTQAFVQAQSKYTASFLEQCRDRDYLKKALEASFSYEKKSAPSLQGDGNIYWSYNPGLRNQAATYRLPKDRLDEYASLKDVDQCLFFDPNLLSDDGTVAKTSSAFSRAGDLYAYSLSSGGSDWVTVYIRKTSSPHPSSGTIDRDNDGRLPDVLRDVKFSSLAWLVDGSGLLYQRFPSSVSEGEKGKEATSNKDAKVYFHKLETGQDDDVLVYHDANEPDQVYGCETTDDGKYVVLDIRIDTGRRVKIYVASLVAGKVPTHEGLQWTKVIDEFSDEWNYLANDGSLFYFSTTESASRGKIVAIDIETMERRDVVQERDAGVLEFAHVAAQDKLVLVYTVDVKSKVFVHDLATGKLIKQLFADKGDFIGSVTEMTGRREHQSFFCSWTTFTSPSAIWRVSFDSGDIKTNLIQEVKVGSLEGFDVSQVFFESKDSTKIPMFIVKARGYEGPRPLLLYGYAGFSIPLLPAFSVSLLTFAKTYGGAFAFVNGRGGSEYGESWHLAGTKAQKQNCFDDFQAAARYLVKEGYTTHDRMSTNGGSNGGLLVSACENQAPELFGACISEVGVLDMLRFHRFTIGRLWTSDYGCADHAEDFDYLYAYSPLHNVRKDVVYPPTLLMTADRDDRVVPAHSLKMGATLQHLKPDNPNPLLLRIDVNSGHGAGKSTAKRIEEAVDKYSFLAEVLDLERVEK